MNSIHLDIIKFKSQAENKKLSQSAEELLLEDIREGNMDAIPVLVDAC